MAKWGDVLTLVATPAPDPDADTNENGFYDVPPEQSRQIFVNKKSVGYSEFYKSSQAGQKAEIKFDARALEYHGEEIAEYGGKRYKVLRTYGSKNNEFVELTLSDLPHRNNAPADMDENQEGGGEDGDV